MAAIKKNNSPVIKKDLFNDGLEDHKAGRILEAKSKYEALLEREPSHFDALQLLALINTNLKKYNIAQSLYEKALAINPSNAVVLNNYANLLKELKHYQESLEKYDQAIYLKPDYAEAYANRATILRYLNRCEEGLRSVDEAIRLKPDHVVAFSNRGNILRQMGLYELALESYDQAISIQPKYLDAWINRGAILKILNRYQDAIASYDQALQLKPDHAEAYFGKGVILRDDLQNIEAALEAFNEAIRIRPDYAEALNDRGALLRQLNRYEEALDSYDAAIRIQPKYPEAWSNRGNVLMRLKKTDLALESYNEAIRILPDFAQAYLNRSNIYISKNQHKLAFKDCLKILGFRPDFSEAWLNLGNLLMRNKKLKFALNCFHKSVVLKSDWPEASWNKSLLLILMGNYLEGWELYEARLNKSDLKAKYYTFPQLSWRGNEDLSGKRLFVYAEQGFGDTIQFCRYIPKLVEMGVEVIFEVPRSLKTLIGSLGTSFTLIEKGQAIPEFDAHCPLMSMPHVFKTTLETIPAETPYLFADKTKVAAWKKELGRKRKKRIGLVWSGSKQHKGDAQRSIAVKLLGQLLHLPFEFHSLQVEYRDSDLDYLKQQTKIKRHEHQLKDFSDTAALIDCMDLVISVDTSVAHLAASMGKPTWILLPAVPDYRWLMERQDSPWYPNVKLFRQSTWFEWEPVIGEVKKMLEA